MAEFGTLNLTDAFNLIKNISGYIDDRKNKGVNDALQAVSVQEQLYPGQPVTDQAVLSPLDQAMQKRYGTGLKRDPSTMQNTSGQSMEDPFMPDKNPSPLSTAVQAATSKDDPNFATLKQGAFAPVKAPAQKKIYSMQNGKLVQVGNEDPGSENVRDYAGEQQAKQTYDSGESDKDRTFRAGQTDKTLAHEDQTQQNTQAFTAGQKELDRIQTYVNPDEKSQHGDYVKGKAPQGWIPLEEHQKGEYYKMLGEYHIGQLGNQGVRGGKQYVDPDGNIVYLTPEQETNPENLKGLKPYEKPKAKGGFSDFMGDGKAQGKQGSSKPEASPENKTRALELLKQRGLIQ